VGENDRERKRERKSERKRERERVRVGERGRERERFLKFYHYPLPFTITPYIKNFIKKFQNFKNFRCFF